MIVPFASYLQIVPLPASCGCSHSSCSSCCCWHFCCCAAGNTALAAKRASRYETLTFTPVDNVYLPRPSGSNAPSVFSWHRAVLPCCLAVKEVGITHDSLAVDALPSHQGLCWICVTLVLCSLQVVWLASRKMSICSASLCSPQTIWTRRWWGPAHPKEPMWFAGRSQITCTDPPLTRRFWWSPTRKRSVSDAQL